MRKRMIGLGFVALCGAASAAEVPPASAGVVACQGTNAVAYPRAARQQRAEGTVALKVFVAAGGRAQQVSLAKSSGSFDLDRAARLAARSTALCRLDGRTPAEAGWADLRVTYRLERLYADL